MFDADRLIQRGSLKRHFIREEHHKGRREWSATHQKLGDNNCQVRWMHTEVQLKEERRNDVHPARSPNSGFRNTGQQMKLLASRRKMSWHWEGHFIKRYCVPQKTETITRKSIGYLWLGPMYVIPINMYQSILQGAIKLELWRWWRDGLQQFPETL